MVDKMWLRWCKCGDGGGGDGGGGDGGGGDGGGVMVEVMMIVVE